MRSAHNLIDMTGKRFGRLIVINKGEAKTRRAYWVCKCDCGNTTIVCGAKLRNSWTQSCGCLQKQMSSDKNKTHGGRRLTEYYIFRLMKDRCTNEKNTSFVNYGGRGITVLWPSFKAFIADMGPRPSRQHTIERVNNDGPYSKDNCRWATRQEQAENKRSNIMITYNGQTMILKQWAIHLGLPYKQLHARLTQGWSVERAFTSPIRVGNYKRKL